MKSIINCRGQALLETIVSFKFMLALLILLLAGSHRIGTFYLLDFWSYQSALCMTEEKTVSECKYVFENKLKLLPFVSIKDLKLSKYNFFITSYIVYKVPGIKKNQTITNKLTLPIKPYDFKVAQ